MSMSSPHRIHGLRSETDERALSPRWIAPLFLVMVILLIPWIAYLAYSLPSRNLATHYRLSWIGFDVFLLLTMTRTSWLAFKQSPGVALPAVATSTLLVIDAWFDITTSHPGWPLVQAILLALFVELPTAALALYLSHRIQRLTGI